MRVGNRKYLHYSYNLTVFRLPAQETRERVIDAMNPGKPAGGKGGALKEFFHILHVDFPE
jgi:hypothetical protein